MIYSHNAWSQAVHTGLRTWALPSSDRSLRVCGLRVAMPKTRCFNLSLYMCLCCSLKVGPTHGFSIAGCENNASLDLEQQQHEPESLGAQYVMHSILIYKGQAKVYVYMYTQIHMYVYLSTYVYICARSTWTFYDANGKATNQPQTTPSFAHLYKATAATHLKLKPHVLLLYGCQYLHHTPQIDLTLV